MILNSANVIVGKAEQRNEANSMAKEIALTSKESLTLYEKIAVAVYEESATIKEAHRG